MALRAIPILALTLAALTAMGGTSPAGGTRHAGPLPLAPAEATTIPPAAAPAAVVPLQAGRIESFAKPAGSPPRYRIDLRPGQFLHVAADQLGMDVKLILRDPSGRELLSADSPNSQWGPEDLYFVARDPGAYRIDVQEVNSAPGGGFTLRLAELRPVTARNTLRAAACEELSVGGLQANGKDAARRAALRNYERAAEIWRLLGESESEAFAETRLGRVWRKLSNPEATIQHLEKALALLTAAGRAHTLPALLNDLGNAYAERGDAERAQAAHEDALVGSRRRGDRREEAMALLDLANLEQAAGASWPALERIRQALPICREIGDSCEADAMRNRGSIEIELSRVDEAREDFSTAATLYHRLRNLRSEGYADMELGWALRRAGDTIAARTDLTRALELERLADDRRATAVVLDRLGSLERDSGNFQRAVADYRQALRILVTIGEPTNTARTLSNLSEAVSGTGDAIAARRIADQAVALLKTTHDPASEAYARFRRARAERALNLLPEARADMEQGLTGIESMRDQAVSATLRQSYLDSVHEEYEFLIDLLMDLHARQPSGGFDLAAVAVAERATARSLLDLLASPRQPGGNGADSDLERLRAVDEQIRIAETPAPGAPAAVVEAEPDAAEMTRIRGLLAERQRILVNSDGTAGTAAQAHLLIADEIQHGLLDAGTVLLIYSLGERRSFVWAVTATSVESAILPPRAEIERGALRLHDLLAGSGSQGTAVQARLTGQVLSDLLLAKVAASLRGRRIAVVPDGALAYVPFGALPDPAGGGELLAAHEVVILPSASALAAIRQRAANRRPAPGLLVILADPEVQPMEAGRPAAAGEGAAGKPPAPLLPVAPLASLSPLAPLASLASLASLAPRAPLGSLAPPAPPAPPAAVTRSVRDLGLRQLLPLPYARQEARAIQAFAPPARRFVAVGADASLALVTRGALALYQILHFATHALIHPSAPELSGIVLAAPDAAGHPRPGFLQSFEISELHLAAELVVLSACRTALGPEVHGEGLLGLTQSFFQAGATRIVVSLWDVDDRATAILMERFYTELLLHHQPPAAALRAAQLALRADPRFAAPYYWAGFELQGDWRAMP